MKFIFLLSFICMKVSKINLTMQNTQSVYIPVYCGVASMCNGVSCSQNGNCFVDIFKYYNQSNTQTLEESSMCICNTGWVSNLEDKVKCCYSRKLQSIAFLLEFIFGFGCGHFYIGNYNIGMIKFISYLINCFIFCLSSFIMFYLESNFYKESTVGSSVKEKSGNKISSLFLLMSLSIYFIWQIVDGVLFGMNFYTDGVGHALQEW